MGLAQEIKKEMAPARKRDRARCGHFEQVKAGSKWQCVTCGKTLTIPESIQNSIELSDVMKSASESRRTLNESLDELLGQKEWDSVRAKIPQQKRRRKS